MDLGIGAGSLAMKDMIWSFRYSLRKLKGLVPAECVDEKLGLECAV